MKLTIGSTLKSGTYTIDRHLYTTDCCEVYAAHVGSTGQKVRLHCLLENLSTHSAEFIAKAIALESVSDPSFAVISDAFSDSDIAIFVNEDTQGITLEEMTSEHALDPRKATDIFSTLAKVVEKAHSAGQILLDISPSTVTVNSSGLPVITDFSIPVELDADSINPYCSPERYRTEVSARPEDDIYSLGAVFYRMLIGKNPPLSSEIENDGIDYPDEIPYELADLIDKAMEPRPNNRYYSIANMLADLPGTQEKQKPKEQPIQPAPAPIPAPAEPQPQRQPEPSDLSDLSDKSDTPEPAPTPEAVPEPEPTPEPTPIPEPKPEPKPQPQPKPAFKPAPAPFTPPTPASPQPTAPPVAPPPPTPSHDSHISHDSHAPQPATNSGKRVIYAVIGLIVTGIICGIVYVLLPESDSEKIPAIEAPIIAEDNDTKTVEDAPMRVDGIKFLYSGPVNDDNMPEGKGIARYETGLWTSYEGEFHEGYRHGKGKLLYRNGDSYEGEFIDGMYSTGTYRTSPAPDGSYDYFTGEFTNGTPYNGSWYHSDGKEYQKVVNGNAKF